MPGPLIPLLVIGALGAAAVFAANNKSANAAPAGSAQGPRAPQIVPGLPPIPVPNGKYDPGMPDEVVRGVDAALELGTDPDKLDAYAQSMLATPPGPFPIAASALRAKAAILRLARASGIVIPPLPPQPVVVPSTPALPVFVPPSAPDPGGGPTPSPFTPPSMPSVPAAAHFEPGPFPKLPPIPAAGHNKTTAHKNGQTQLVNFLEREQINELNVLPAAIMKGQHYTRTQDTDGDVGSRTQAVTWLFQRFSNQMHGTKLGEDGLFGTETYNALANYA